MGLGVLNVTVERNAEFVEDIAKRNWVDNEEEGNVMDKRDRFMF